MMRSNASWSLIAAAALAALLPDASSGAAERRPASRTAHTPIVAAGRYRLPCLRSRYSSAARIWPAFHVVQSSLSRRSVAPVIRSTSLVQTTSWGYPLCSGFLVRFPPLAMVLLAVRFARAHRPRRPGDHASVLCCRSGPRFTCRYWSSCRGRASLARVSMGRTTLPSSGASAIRPPRMGWGSARIAMVEGLLSHLRQFVLQIQCVAERWVAVRQGFEPWEEVIAPSTV